MATNKTESALQTTQPTEALAASERFTSTVMKEFGSNISGALQVTDYQRTLVQGYFIGIDRALKTAEAARVRKNESNSDHKYDNTLPIVWANVNLNELALDVIHYARMGLDMMQPNHLFPIPYKNKKTQKYDVTLMPGYNGIRYIAEKYAVDKPIDVTTELVYSTDVFKALKKNVNNKVENYEFDIVNPFNRGVISGGFGYIEYDDPTKNKLIIMTMEDFEKRKPDYASVEFWGGKRVEYVNGKKTESEVAGWFSDMCLKTIKREVYSAKNMPRDPKKVDDAYQYMKLREARYAEIEAQSEINQNANTVLIEGTSYETPETLPAIMDTNTGEVFETRKASGAAKPGKAEQVEIESPTF